MSESIFNAVTTISRDEKVTTIAPEYSIFVGGGGNIPDGNGSFQDDIVIEENFCIGEVKVTLQDFVHTWVGDLVVRLRHLETNTVVDLFRRPGQPKFSSSGYCSDLNGDYSFNNYSDQNFEVAAAEHELIPSGNYASVQSLSTLGGMPSTGTWRLIINDCSAGDSGSLGSWKLELSRN
ncbi:MAG: hypothetical protein F6K16_27645 [Symploca sp. SIO2B6]|nr:hypothetical protein [Symploca sp. SIO2B6]